VRPGLIPVVGMNIGKARNERKQSAGGKKNGKPIWQSRISGWMARNQYLSNQRCRAQVPTMSSTASIVNGRKSMTITLRELYAALVLAWGADNAFGNEWSEMVPDLGQCAVTALVIQDYFGGSLLRCPFPPDGSHYWNLLSDGQEIDFTRGQFEYLGRFPYRHKVELRARDYVLSFPDTSMRYSILKQRVNRIHQRTRCTWLMIMKRSSG
jgi:hypothetical protein